MTPLDRGDAPSPATGTFDDALGDLDRIRDSCRRGQDRNGYFAAMYGRVTAAVQARAAAGRFEDPERMERFVVAFARRYTNAYRSRSAERPTTQSWRLAFDTAERRDPLVVQHLLLGMNAHINLDLGIVTAELARRERSLDAMAADFGAINGVLAEMVDRCQAAVVAASPVLALVDDLLAEHDEAAATFSLRVARDGAWAFAEQLHSAEPQRWEELVAARDRSVAEVGTRLLATAGPAASLTAVLRATEWRPVGDVVTLLADIPID